MQKRRSTRCYTIVLASLLMAGTLASCSSSDVEIDGLKVANGEEIAAAGVAKLKDENAVELQSQASTISGATDCFFVKSAPDIDDVTAALACGPIRRLGVSDSAVWDTYSLQLTQDAKGQTSAELAEMASYAQEMAPELLVSPTGAEPAPLDEVPKPSAPAAQKVNLAAVLVQETPLAADFKPVDDPTALITPAANVQVTSTADLETLPAVLEVGQASESPVPFYRPAEGQRAIAVKVKISPTTMQNAPSTSSYGSAEEVSLSTKLGLEVGDRQIDIVDDSESGGYGTENQSGPTIECSQVPCDTQAETSELTIVASVPAEGAVALSTLVNGETQTLNLSSGERGGSVSPVDYDRDQRSVDVNKTISTELTRKSKYSDDTCQWSVSIQQATLSGFDSRKGWAKENKAWVGVSFEGFDKSYGCFGSFRDEEEVKSVRLQVGKTEIKPSYASDNLMVFQVPSTIEKSSLIYTPRGQFTGGETDSGFTAKPAKANITFKK